MPNRQTEPQLENRELTLRKALAERFGITCRQAEFLESYTQHRNIVRAANAIGTDRSLHYRSYDRSENYVKAYHHVLLLLVDEILQGMIEDAINGEIVYYQGEPVIDPETGNPARKKDTILRIFLTKSILKLTDQPDPGRTKTSTGPTVNIYLPEQHSKPVIEVENEAEE